MYRFGLLLAAAGLLLAAGAGLAQNADTVDLIHASATPVANRLLALDGSSHFPSSVWEVPFTLTGTTSSAVFKGFNYSTTADSSGVCGYSFAATGATRGIVGASDSTSGIGVYGTATAGSGTTYGVRGSVASSSGYAGYFTGGQNYFQGRVGIGTTSPAAKLEVDAGYGVHGVYAHTTYIGVWGAHLGTGTFPGVQGDTESTSSGASGVRGKVTSTTPGSLSAGVYGLNYGTGSEGIGVRGYHYGDGYGVYGSTLTGYGVYGKEDTTGTYGYLGGSTQGAYGESGTNGNYGYLGGNYGAYGKSYTTSAGVCGSNSVNDPAAIGVYGYCPYARAGYFYGDVEVIDDLTVSGDKDFKIDHPLDPENMYLYHSCVESSERMNIYNGRVVLDARGEAWVQLPDWFEALNCDFLYQLTPIGAPGPNLYIAQEISDGWFSIAGGSPGMKVCWQVTGTRKDAYALGHPFEVEVEKPEIERGYYIHPELYGMPDTSSIEWATHPEMMEEMSKDR